MHISPKQIKLGRIHLDWTQSDLAARAGVSKDTILNLENGKNLPQQANFNRIVDALQNAGIEFLEGEGVRKRRSYVQILNGTVGLIALMDDVYETASTAGGDICLYNAKPENWLDWVTVDWFKMHAKRMTDVAHNFRMRILVEEGNTKLISSFYAIHRWFPRERFISEHESLYVYGNKLGFVHFRNNDVEIQILQSQQFANGMRALFNVAWDYVGIMPTIGEKLEKVDFAEWEKGN